MTVHAGDAGNVTTDVRRGRTARRRFALGLSLMPGPGLALLLLGLALGPYGLGLLTESVLTSLDPVISVALAALGVFVGFDVAVRSPREGRAFAASIVLVATTMAIVAASVVIVEWWSSSELSGWFLPALLGLCAASSSIATDAAGDARGASAARIGNLGDLLLILLSMAALAATHREPAAASALLVAKSALIALTIALAALLLVTQTSSDSEQRVFAFGALLLLGGAAAHLSLSALFTGLVAGVVWKVVGPPASEAIARDVRYLQDPLIVLLLVVAGARAPLSYGVAALVAVYIIFRLVGRLIAAWLVSKTVIRETTVNLRSHLVAPGAVGIAIVLNVLQANPDLDAARTALTVVVLGSVISELQALIVPRLDVDA
jgi:hypothetical protein